MTSVLASLRALTVAIVGVFLALLWTRGLGWASISLAAGGILLGLALDWLGRGLLPDHPIAALQSMEWWLLAPLTLAAAGAATVIIVAIELAVPEGTPADTKQLVAALAAGITAFVTSAFISWTGDQKDSILADHIQAVFEKAYMNSVFDDEGERWVYSAWIDGLTGWGRQARLARAHGIANDLRPGVYQPEQLVQDDNATRDEQPDPDK
jgi:hypothetical protein